MKCSSPVGGGGGGGRGGIGGGLVVIKPTHCNVVAPFRLRNVEQSSDYDPLTKRQIFRRKESSQWEHPSGPGHFQQYSKVLDEKSTFAPSLHQKEQGTFEFLTSKCGDTNTRAIRSEQKFQEVRHINNDDDDDEGGGGRGGGKTRKSSSIRLVTTVQSFSTTTAKYSKGLLQDVTTVSDLGYCPPATKFNGNLEPCVHSNGNNTQKKDWELDIASLEKNTQRLDNSVQIEKKNLSKNGSLSKRRPPTRSNLKNIMTEFLSNGQELSKQVFSDNKVTNGTSDKYENGNNKESFIVEREFTKPVVVSSLKNNKNDARNFRTSKEVLIQKSIEIPKEVELLLFDARKQQQQQRTEELHKEEKCHWLQEAKQNLRKCQSSFPIEINGRNASDFNREKIFKNEQRPNIEHYSINSSKLIKMNGHSSINSNLEFEQKRSYESSNGGSYRKSEETEVNRNVVTLTSNDDGNDDVDRYDYPDINRNSCDNDSKERTGSELFGYDSDSDSEECDTVVENFSLSSVLQKLQGEGCVLSVPPLEMKHGEHSKPSESPEPLVQPSEPPLVITSVLEKNKSKSTSNLDDDETMEAPWFQHPTYQRPSRIVDEMREFAKSSTNLKCFSSEHGNKLQDRVSLRSRPIPEENAVNLSFSEEEEEVEEITEQKAPWMNEVKLKSVTNSFKIEKVSSKAPMTSEKTGAVTRNLISLYTAPTENVSEVTVNGGTVEVSLDRTLKRSRNKSSSELYSNSWSSMCHDNVVIIANDSNNRHDKKVTLGHKWTPESRKKESELSVPLNSNCGSRKTSFREFSTKINVSGPTVVSSGLGVRTPGSRLTAVVPPSDDDGQFGVNYPRQIKLRKVTTTQSTSELSASRDYGVVPSNRLSASSPIYSLRFDEESEDDEKRWMHRNVSNTEDHSDVPQFKYRLKTFGENANSFLHKNGSEEVVVTGNSVDETTWQKLEKLEQKNTKISSDTQKPGWIKEAEEKTKSWRNLTALESPQHSSSTSSRASWLEEVKLKRTAASSKARSCDVDTESEGWSPVPPHHPHPDVNEEDDLSTSWKFVRLKSTDKNRVSHDDVHEEPESEESQVMTIEDTSVDDDDVDDDDITSEDMSTSIKSSDQSQETCDFSRGSTLSVPNGGKQPQSEFDVEGYVKELISRRRANKGFQRPSEPQSDNPEWLQISKEKSKNVDWNSLEKLTGTKKVDSLRLDDVSLQKNGGQSSSSSWSRIPKCFSSSEDEDVVMVATKTINDKTVDEKCRSRKILNNSTQKSPSSSSSSSSSQWVSQVQLNSCGSTIRVGGVDVCSDLVVVKTTTTTTTKKREQQHIGKQRPDLNEKNSIMSSDLITTNLNKIVEHSDRQKNGHHKEKSSKRVTFDIPKARSSPDLLHRRHDEDKGSSIVQGGGGDDDDGYPEWVKIAEKKCNKEINWECLDTKQETTSKLTSENKWITQVQLRHVDTKSFQVEEECSKPSMTKLSSSSSEPQKINNIVTVNGHHHYGSNGSSIEEVVNLSNDGIKTSEVLTVAPLSSSSPDWLKVAERKKQAHINWEQLDSSNDEETQVGPSCSKLNGLENSDTNGTSKECSSWHSSDDHLEADTSSLPTWLHLAEKKKKSSIDWTNIERDISIKTCLSSKVKWTQRSSSESSVCDENPFHVSLRHVEQEQGQEDSEDVEEATNITWPVRNGGSDVDRWQVLYKDLFEDLLDESISGPYAVLLSHSESTDEVHMLRGTSEKSRKSKKLTSTLESRQRKRIDLRQHRYYSLPEISCALPRDDHEVEIIQLPTTNNNNNNNDEVENFETRESKFDSTDKKRNSTLENEEKPIVFVKLKPIDKKKNEEEEETTNRCWLNRIKLRKTLTSTMDESTASTSGFKRKESVGVGGGGGGGGGHRETSNILSSSKMTTSSMTPNPLRKPLLSSQNRYSTGFTRTRMCSSQPTVAVSSPTSSTPLQSIREAIHRDIKKEVARRENNKPTKVVATAVAATSVSSTAKELVSETTEQGIGFSPPSKPKWLIELQKKKETQKRAFLSEAPSVSSVAATTTSLKTAPSPTKGHLDITPPSYISVMDQIKSMGKEKLFANLRKCPIEVATTTTATTKTTTSATLVPLGKEVSNNGHETTITMETETTGCFSKKTLIRDDKNRNGNVKCGSIVAASRSDKSSTIEKFSGSIVDIVKSPIISSSSAPTCVVSRTASDVSVTSPSKKFSKTTAVKEEKVEEAEEEKEEEESLRCSNNDKNASLMLKKHFEYQLTSAKQLVNGTKDKIGINLKQNCSSNAKMYSVSSKWRASITNNGSMEQEIVIKNNTMATTTTRAEDERRKERRRNTIEFVSTSQFRHGETESKHFSTSFDGNAATAAATASDELKSPLLLMNLMSCLNKSSSDTNLTIINQGKNSSITSATDVTSDTTTTTTTASTSSSMITKRIKAATSCTDLRKPSTITVKTFEKIGGEKSSSYRSEMSLSVDDVPPKKTVLGLNEVAKTASEHEPIAIDNQNDFDLKLTTKCVYDVNLDASGKAN